MDTYWDRLWERGYDANMGDGAARAYWSDEERAAAYDDEVSANNWERGNASWNPYPAAPAHAFSTSGQVRGLLPFPCPLLPPTSRPLSRARP
jgi:hypothetical protein